MISKSSRAIKNFPSVAFWQHYRLVAPPYRFRNFEGRYRHLHAAMMYTPQPTKAISQQSLEDWFEKPNYRLSLQNKGLSHLHFHEAFYDFQCTK